MLATLIRFNTRYLIVLFIFLFSVGLQAKISKVDLSQLPPDMQKSISNHFSISKSTKINLEKLKKIILFIMNNQQYYDVQVFKDTEENIFIIKSFSKSYWKNINIKGVEKIKISKIQNLISDILINKDHTEIIKRIKKIYEDEGFFHTSIKVNLSDNTLNLDVREGEMTYIKKIIFESENKALNNLLKRGLIKYYRLPLHKKNKKKIEKRINDISYKNNYFHLKHRLEIVYKGNSVELQYKLSNVDKFNIYFYGNNQISSSTLISLLNIKKQKFSHVHPNKDLKIKLKKVYIEQGYPFVDIDSDLIIKKKNKVQFKFYIKEGNRVYINKIRFYGLLSKNNKFYSNFILNNQPGNSIISKRVFVKQNIYFALEKLLSYLRNKGWFEAKVIYLRVTYNNNKNKANILVNLQEGMPYLIEDIKMTHNKSFSKETLSSLISLKTNSIFDINQLNEDINKIIKFYHESGFLDMKFTKQIKDMISYSRNKISINLQIDEGFPVYVKDIMIEGNNITKRELILRETYFKKGDLLTSKKINESIDRLQNLNLFSYVKINLKKNTMKLKYRTVIISVIESSPGIFNFGFGINNLHGLTLKGYTGISYNNLYGTGNGFSGKLQTSYSIYDIYFLEKEASISYFEPYFLDYSIKSRVSLSYEELITDYREKLITINNRFLSSLEKEFNKNIRFIWNFFELEILEFYYLNESFFREHKTIGSIGPFLEFNYLDNIFSPKKGFLTTFKIKYSNPIFLILQKFIF